MTETQENYSKVDFSNHLAAVSSYRETNNVKGGGLKIIYKKAHMNIEKLPTEDRNILHAELKCGNMEMCIILVYLSCTDFQRNVKIKKEINDIANKAQHKHVIILGDFNGHVGFLGPQTLNRSGELVLEMTEELDYTILNGTPQCVGEITRSQNNFESAIYLALVNGKLLNNYTHMTIDEDKNIFDLSDHNLIKVFFLINNPALCKQQTPTDLAQGWTANLLNLPYVKRYTCNFLL